MQFFCQLCRLGDCDTSYSNTWVSTTVGSILTGRYSSSWANEGLSDSIAGDEVRVVNESSQWVKKKSNSNPLEDAGHLGAVTRRGQENDPVSGGRSRLISGVGGDGAGDTGGELDDGRGGGDGELDRGQSSRGGSSGRRKGISWQIGRNQAAGSGRLDGRARNGVARGQEDGRDDGDCDKIAGRWLRRKRNAT